MKVFGISLSLSGTKSEAKQKEPAASAPKPVVVSELPLSASTIKILLMQAQQPTNKIELLLLYETGLSAPACPMSPALSNYILDISLNNEDKGVRRAARDVVIKTLAHDTILAAWDSNRDGQPEELSDVVVLCLKVANDSSREYDVRFDAFTVAERIVMRLPERATEPVHSLLTSLALLQNHQLGDKAKDLLHYVEDQTKEAPSRDPASALRALAARGKAADLSAKGYET